MKRATLGLVALVTCGGIWPMQSMRAQAQASRDYWYLTVSSDQTIVDYIDAASIVSVDPEVKRVWVWIVRSRRAAEFSGSTMVTLEEVNCKKRMRHALQMTAYDAKGNVYLPWSDDTPEPWEYVVPNSFGESELNFACSEPSARIGVRLGADVTPEQDAERLFGTSAP